MVTVVKRRLAGTDSRETMGVGQEASMRQFDAVRGRLLMAKRSFRVTPEIAVDAGEILDASSITVDVQRLCDARLLVPYSGPVVKCTCGCGKTWRDEDSMRAH